MKLIDKNIEFLGGDFGKEVLNEVNLRYNNFDVVVGMGSYSNTSIPGRYILLDRCSLPDTPAKIVTGSNPFLVVAINKIIRQQGLRTATQADLEKEIRRNPNFSLKNVGVDTGLILRSNEQPLDLNHTYLQKYLKEQLKTRGEERSPIMIPLAGLDLEQNSSARYGLAFKLRDDAELIYAPILNFKGYRGEFLPENVNERTGLPNKLTKDESKLGKKSMKRKFVNGSGGLGRMFTHGEPPELNIATNLEGLMPAGRIVIVNERKIRKSRTSF